MVVDKLKEWSIAVERRKIIATVEISFFYFSGALKLGGREEEIRV